MNGDDSTKTHNTPKVEISVRNFGPIAEADLDLRPLTVFVGPSNTGKTYLSVLIYALQRIFEDFLDFPSLYISRLLGYGLRYDLTDREILLAVLDKLNSDQPFKFSDLPQAIREQAQSKLKNIEVDGDDLETELKRCFDLGSVSELRRSYISQNDETTVSLIVSEEHQDLWSFKIGTSKSKITMDGEINENTIIFSEDWFPSTQRISFEYLSERFVGRRSNTERPYYLPAARSGIMQIHRVIASSLVARSTRAGLETLEMPTLSAVVADFLEELIFYREQIRSENKINHIADALESDVLDGQIIMKPSPTGYPEFLYRPQGIEQDMRLTRSSSMVSELAPLVLFIRGLVRPGDTLIIEEPEAHLHPAAQTQMAATLARLVRAGVRVIVTTHSDFMLQEIGNLIREGELGEKTGEPASWLDQEEVGAWLFQKNGKVKEIEFDRIKGIEPMEYEDVAEALYNRWADLQYQLDKKTGDEEDKV